MERSPSSASTLQGMNSPTATHTVNDTTIAISDEAPITFSSLASPLTLPNPADVMVVDNITNTTHHLIRKSSRHSALSEKHEPLDKIATNADSSHDPCSNDQDKEQHAGQEGDHSSEVLEYPEGGFGWLVVFGSFWMNFTAFGPNFAWGVYNEYYQHSHYFGVDTLATNIAWTGGISSASFFLLGPFISTITNRFGYKPMLIGGNIMCGAGLILASFATELWQLYLTQGFLYGMGGGFAFFASFAVPATWFERKRGLAVGLAVSGSGIGGLVFSPLTRALISSVGVQWALRITGILVTAIMFAVFPFIRPRETSFHTAASLAAAVEKRKQQPIFDFSLFKIPGFWNLYALGSCATFGYLVIPFLLPTYMTTYGHSASTAAAFVSIFAGVNALFRVVLGMLADRVGHMNVLVLCTFLSGLSCLVLWMFSAHSMAVLILFVISYGVNGGGYVSLFSVVAAKIVGIERLPAAIGMLYTSNILGNLCGSPIASAIVAAGNGDFRWAIFFAGIMPALGASILAIHRFQLSKSPFAKI